jgi:hypothetical protein
LKEPAPIRNAADGTFVVRGVSRPAGTRLGKRKTGSTVLIIKMRGKKEAPEFERRSTIEKPCNARVNRLIDREARDFGSGLKLLGLGR